MDERHSGILRYGRERAFDGMEWSLAACAGVGVGLFYVGSGESVKEAKAMCSACVIRAECLAYALVGMEKYGVWGGTSEQERRGLRRRLRGAA